MFYWFTTNTKRCFGKDSLSPTRAKQKRAKEEKKRCFRAFADMSKYILVFILASWFRSSFTFSAYLNVIGQTLTTSLLLLQSVIIQYNKEMVRHSNWSVNLAEGFHLAKMVDSTRSEQNLPSFRSFFRGLMAHSIPTRTLQL